MPALAVEAVRLFTERAVAANPRFALTERNALAVAEITARLDGLPLAIELAATRTKVLTPRRSCPVSGGACRSSPPGRGACRAPATLRAAIAWSYDLLDPVERRLFARLSVFTGGWAFASAEAVCDLEELGLDALDGLTSLVDKSLIRRSEPPGRPSRFSMLETIREFGLEQLEASGDLEPVQRRHAEHFLRLAIEAEPHLIADDQGVWLDRCEQEHANLRAALRWAIDRGEAGPPRRPPGPCGGSGSSAGTWPRAAAGWTRPWPCRRGRRRPRSGQGPGRGGRDRGGATGGGTGFYDEALAIERELGDPARLAEALYNEAFVAAAEHDLEAAARLLDESLELFARSGTSPGWPGSW